MKILYGSFQNHSFLELKHQLKINTKTLEDNLFFLSKQAYIEEQSFWDQESIGLINYDIDNKGMEFINQGSKHLPSEYKISLKIDPKKAKYILNTIREQNQKGTFPTKFSCYRSIFQQTKNLNLPEFYDHIIYLKYTGKIKTKRYTGPGIGYEDIIVKN